MAQLKDQENDNNQGSMESSMHVSLVSFEPNEQTDEIKIKVLESPVMEPSTAHATKEKANTPIINENITISAKPEQQTLNEEEIRERLKIFTQSLQENNVDVEENSSTTGSSSSSNNDNSRQNTTTISSNTRPSTSRNMHYKKYTDEQITGYINLIIEGMSVKSAAAKSGITANSAYRFRKMWNKAGVTPVRHKRGPAEGAMSKLKEEHTKFIINYVDHEVANGSLAQIKDALQKEFHDLSVSSSALHRHMKAKCAFSLKRMYKSLEARNDADFMALIEQWIASKDMDFENNCIFISEAKFLRVDRNNGWANKTKKSSSTIPTEEATITTSTELESSQQPQKKSSSGVIFTVLGAISSKGIMDISLRRATQTDTMATTTTLLGKRRLEDAPVNSNQEDYNQFLNYLTELMNILDKHGLQGNYLVLDDTNIREPMLVRKRVEERGYKCAYLPAVMPVPNPMEKLWAKMQKGIDRKPLNGDLSQRIMKSCSEITPDDCREWIRLAIPCSPLRITSGRGLYT
ncbi:uncharacterized protein BX663DRAFT_525507 [Cokeromyces recurvatus]|uniref:uncharacterized protein n=1 Tax=Cokeromyces recurvatus TaxID=90255 RepID=UPI00222026D1|nr:uncharacterized protein BX663DRAFT_525507 [Cokeromyces recurvatus]KAI7898350.1 hypothetical protein BX663DRAFT_525507 [Cokeromyces recurvatus]